MTNAPPKSTFSRASKLFKAGASTLTKEVGLRLKNSETAKKVASKIREEQMHVLVKALSELKGGAMKAGQLLSMEATEWLPPELQEILASLYQNATKVNYEDMKKVLLEDLGEERLQDLNLNESPLAAASIGQVYKGELNKEEIVCKVQYPGIAKSVDSDIGILSKTLKGFSVLSGRRIELNELFEEIRFVMGNETNYITERNNLESFQQAFNNHPHFHIPRAYPEYSSQRVLTMSYETGVNLDEWIRSNPNYEQKLHIAKLLMDLYITEYYQIGLVQTDPNLGNFLVSPNSQKLTLLDFGSVVEYDYDFRKRYYELSKVLFEKDFQSTIEAACELDFIKEKESDETKKLFYEMMEVAVEPFTSEKFDFGDLEYSKRTRRSVWEFVKTVRHTPPPRRLIFLHRRMGGLFHTIKQLNVKVDVRPFYDKIETLLANPIQITNTPS